MNHLWIVYDARAEYQDTEDCWVLVTCESEQEAWNYVDNDLPDGVVFKYDLVPDGDDTSAENERRVYR